MADSGGADRTFLATGDRVGIRPFTREDRAEFTALARASVRQHRPWLFPPTTDEAYDRYLAKLAEPSRRGFLLCEPGGPGETGEPEGVEGAEGEESDEGRGRIAGFVTINNIVHGAFESGAAGYGAFAHAAGRGLMSEGLGLVLRYSFGELGLHRIEVNIQPGNEASIALVRRAGFRLEGYSPDFLFIDGAWRDHQRWAITTEMLPGGDTAQ